MNIDIDSDVIIPRDAPRVIKHKPITDKIPTAMNNVVAAYQDAYKVIYGFTPAVTFKDGYIRIQGHDGGVTKTRLREMTHQLRWRAG